MLKTNKARAAARVAVIVVAAAALAVIPTEMLARFPTVCLFKNLLGVSCPGCGMTRAFSALLHGDLSGAVAYNKLIIVVAPAVAGLLLYDLAFLLSQFKRSKPQTA